MRQGGFLPLCDWLVAKTLEVMNGDTAAASEFDEVPLLPTPTASMGNGNLVLLRWNGYHHNLNETITEHGLLPTETRLTEDQARQLTDRIRDAGQSAHEALIRFRKLIDEAREGAAHVVLGYESWPAYVNEEFAGLLSGLPRVDRQKATRELAAAGLSNRIVAGVLGVGKSTIHRDLSGVPDGTPDRERTSKVTGHDGKTYPRRKARTRTSQRDADDEATAAVRSHHATTQRLRRLAEAGCLPAHRAGELRADIVTLTDILADLDRRSGT